MFLLPMGVRGRPPKIPWLAITIVLSTVAYSMTQFDHVDNFSIHLMNSEAFKEQHKTHSLFVIAYCPATELSEQECTRLRLALENVSYHNSAMLKDRLQKMKAKSHTAKSIKRILTYYRQTEDPEKMQDPQLAQMQTYLAYLAAKQESLRFQNNYLQDGGFLSLNSISAKSIVKAQFLHGGWMHLLGNMLIFFVFAFPLESRLKPWFFSSVYLFGGGLGLLANVLFAMKPGTPLLGASANVTATAGAFAVLFWPAQMRVWFSAVFYNRFFFIPVALGIPYLILANDVIGATQNQDSGIGHVAHLAGFASGALLGLLYKSLYPLPHEFFYEKEFETYQHVQKMPLSEERMQLSEKILYWNPQNFLLRQETLAAISEQVRSKEKQAELQTSTLSDTFLKQHLEYILQDLFKKQAFKRLLETCAELPITLNLHSYFYMIEQKTLLYIADTSVKKGDWFTALRFYDVFLSLYPDVKSAPAIRQTITNLLLRLQNMILEPAQLSDIQLYIKSQTHSSITPQLEAMFNVNAA